MNRAMDGQHRLAFRNTDAWSYTVAKAKLDRQVIIDCNFHVQLLNPSCSAADLNL
jgi:hypothetical protein